MYTHSLPDEKLVVTTPPGQFVESEGWGGVVRREVPVVASAVPLGPKADMHIAAYIYPVRRCARCSFSQHAAAWLELAWSQVLSCILSRSCQQHTILMLQQALQAVTRPGAAHTAHAHVHLASLH